MLDKGRWKLPPANLLASSSGRNWSGIGAELRRHSAGEVPEMISNITVIGVAVAGNRDSVIHRRGNGIRQATPALSGTIWLCPQGVSEDAIRVTGTIPEMLHIYLPAGQFSALSRDDDYADIGAELVSYEAGFHDPLIAQIGQVVLAELTQATSSGKLVVEAAALTLAAQLVHKYSTAALSYAARPRPPHALDERRLQRVLAFVEANLENDISVQDLADAACLSPFYFSRAFKRATGRTPHQFVSDRRLDRAKALLAEGRATLAEIALTCNFSSQANFTRAFRRAVGVPPGDYRRRLT